MNIKRERLHIVIAGLIIGVIASLLVFFGNPANMGFCIACFLRDTAGGLGLHRAAAVQYIRPEIIGLVLGSFGIALFKGEFSANGVKNPISHKRGVLSMARAQAMDSAGSQFFIMHADGEFLDGQYAAFGMVTEGMDVVDRIAATKTGMNDKPKADQRMKKVTVETFGVDYPEPEKL